MFSILGMGPLYDRGGPWDIRESCLAVGDLQTDTEQSVLVYQSGNDWTPFSA